MPSKQLHSEVLAGASETAKHQGPERRNDLQKQLPRGLTSLLDSGKNKASAARGLTSLLDSGKNKATSTAGPAAAAAAVAAATAAAAAGAAGADAARLQNAFATPERPPKTCCPEAPLPNTAFWTDKKL